MSARGADATDITVGRGPRPRLLMKNVNDFKRKKIQLKDFDYSGDGIIYFITICTFNSIEYFSNHDIAKAIESELEFRRNDEIHLFCYCIMPNHIHILISFKENYKKNLKIWVSSFKRYSQKIVNEKFSIKKLWHVNFYDHIVRKSEDMANIAQYILQNPVRKKIVEEWHEYPFSKLFTET
jgi:REP element-mobilizing transposase RayT